MDRDARDDIAELEARLETLAESIERCRKISLAAKLAIAAGAAWLVLLLLGWLSSGAFALLLAIAALIGGFVLLGSNSSTWDEWEAERREKEALRERLIEGLEMRVVGKPARTLH